MTNPTTIGTCSLCGGPVQIPGIWMGIFPPTPTCGHCGAVAAQTFGPTIPMVPVTPLSPRTSPFTVNPNTPMVWKTIS